MTKKEKEIMNHHLSLVRAVEATIKAGDKLFFLYDGKRVAEYLFIEWSMDSKSPSDWLMGCFTWEIFLNGLNAEKVTLELERNKDPNFLENYFKSVLG